MQNPTEFAKLWLTLDAFEPMKSNVENWLDDKNACLIVHNGIDGIAAAALAVADGFMGDIYAVGSDTIDYKKMIEPYHSITIVDMSLKERDMRKSQGRDICVYDHHIRNSYIAKYPNCVIDARACACKLYYNYKHKHIYGESEIEEEFIELVNVFDRWQFDSPLFEKSVKLFYLFQSMTKNGPRGALIYQKGNLIESRFKSFINTIIIKVLMETLEYTIDEQIIIDECVVKFRADYHSVLKTLQFRIDERERVFIFCEAIGNISLICNELLNNIKDAQYVIMYHPSIKGLTRFSARSRGMNIDMNELEGFEGHPLAAGCFIEDSVARRIINNRNRYFKTVQYFDPARPPPMSVRRTRGAPPATIIQNRLESNEQRQVSFKK